MYDIWTYSLRPQKYRAWICGKLSKAELDHNFLHTFGLCTQWRWITDYLEYFALTLPCWVCGKELKHFYGYGPMICFCHSEDMTRIHGTERRRHE